MIGTILLLAEATELACPSHSSAPAFLCSQGLPIFCLVPLKPFRAQQKLPSLMESQAETLNS